MKENRLSAWNSHMDGAVNIVRMRGREQMKSSSTGRMLFLAVRHQLVSLNQHLISYRLDFHRSLTRCFG